MYEVYSLFVMDPGKEENYRPMSGISSPYTFSAPFLTFISGLESILYTDKNIIDDSYYLVSNTFPGFPS